MLALKFEVKKLEDGINLLYYKADLLRLKQTRENKIKFDEPCV